MKRITCAVAALWVVMGMMSAVSAGDLLDVRDNPAAPVKLIFDTDMGNDVDDALALAIIHAMADRGKCEFLGITLTKSNVEAARYCRAFNALYGRPDIPIGLVNNGPTPGEGAYVRKVFDVQNDDGTPAFAYPADFQPEDSVKLLRRLLAEAPDDSVVIAQVGFSSNLARLLASLADDISPLTGRELARKKVRLVSAMAGAFTFPHDRFATHREFNVVQDIPAAQKVFHEWPGEIVFSGFEVGIEILMRPTGMQNDFPFGKKNFLQESYRLYRGGLDKNACTWDLTSVLFVLRPEEGRNYFSLSERGRVTVRDDGTTFFTPSADGNCRCFLTSREQMLRVEEAFVNLCTE